MAGVMRAQFSACQDDTCCYLLRSRRNSGLQVQTGISTFNQSVPDRRREVLNSLKRKAALDLKDRYFEISNLITLKLKSRNGQTLAGTVMANYLIFYLKANYLFANSATIFAKEFCSFLSASRYSTPCYPRQKRFPPEKIGADLK
ncbi:hypothetical protein LSTR_LSTR006952 [Laodelphax striatellus]|uniref:Uncharacterized protein n=1 Tax=Laodelphax striatellus TaxID=195883 RepID=A0A482X3N5_LAOST|nr:hypothetical protein LSTR_LSTR006952 [Laodelphax striatellus]